jgi:glyoxylase-like metal-dependent hydrolase (beta-lactamase superfamily II)/ferredoxin
MAKLKLKLKENVDGQFFVDSTCIDCGACRKFAPVNFGATGEFAFVKKQPKSVDEELAAKQALVACPTASIGTVQKTDLKEAQESFPLEIKPGIFINEYNSRDSYGADSYFIQSKSGNWLVDSPRFTKKLVRKFEELGGVKYIFLTHQDDVADSDLYAKHFHSQRIIHEYDSHSSKNAEIVLSSEEDRVIDEGKIIFTPGHTKGHQVLLWNEKYLFTGDHFAWLNRLNRFGSFRDACWHSWEGQIGSVEKLRSLTKVQWVFPGHGHRKQIEDNCFAEIIDDALTWMKSVA